MPWLIANQKLAHQIIATHEFKPDGNILDNQELRILRKYVADPSSVGVDGVFRDLKLFDEQTGKVDEEKVKGSGSLVVHAIVNGGFDEESRELLREWFGDGDVSGKEDKTSTS
jgi:hypothetical protein